MRLTPKRLRLAFRSPGHLRWAVRHVLRRSPLGALERRLGRGWALAPGVVTVNVTGRCNLRCAMCMQPRAGAGEGDTETLRAGREELTPEAWRRVVDDVAPARPAFYFSGGEPLLYRGIIEVLEHVKRRGLIAALVTNATLLERHAEALVEAGVDNVTVSLDGPEAVHDAVRGVAGAFARTAAGLAALREARARAGVRYPALKINCVITPESVPALEGAWEAARAMGAGEFNLQHPIFDAAGNVERHNRVYRERFGADAADAETLSKRAGEFYPMTMTEAEFQRLEETARRLSTRSGGPRVSFFPEVRPGDWRGYYLDPKHPFPDACGAPWRIMRLLADGTFEPCMHHVIGNAAETPALRLWNAPRMRRFRRELARGGLLPACNRCCYREY